MISITRERLVNLGLGISTSTYFKLMYFVPAAFGYGVVTIAVFGRN